MVQFINIEGGIEGGESQSTLPERKEGIVGILTLVNAREVRIGSRLISFTMGYCGDTTQFSFLGFFTKIPLTLFHDCKGK